MGSIADDLKLQFRTGDVITRLILWNAALFAIPFILFGFASLFGVSINWMRFVSLSSSVYDLAWKPWSIFTYAFFHANFFHILFNLIMLNFTGRLFLTFFTQKQLLSLYFVSAAFAGIIYIASYAVFPALSENVATVVGASGSVMAILFAAAAYAPMMEVRLLMIGNVKLWHIAGVLLIIDLVYLSVDNTGGHLVHLGGAFFGYIYVQQIRSGNDLIGWFTKLADGISRIFTGRKKQPFKKVHKNYAPRPAQKVSTIVTKDKVQQQIDEILDKISKSGYDSLTADEKEFLFRAGK